MLFKILSGVSFNQVVSVLDFGLPDVFANKLVGLRARVVTRLKYLPTCKKFRQFVSCIVHLLFQETNVIRRESKREEESFKIERLESLNQENSTEIRTLKLLLTLSKVVATHVKSRAGKRAVRN